jgi:tetratricopeptide (TPR) repeat protein
MQAAYGGRAAAYEKKGDYARAIQDYTTVLLVYGVEADVLNSQEAPDGKLLVKLADAYNARSRCYLAKGKPALAQADLKRAAKLDAEAARLARNKGTPADAAAGGKPDEGGAASRVGQILVLNSWNEPVTVKIDGVSYQVEVGQYKVVTHEPGSFSYEVKAAQYEGKGTVEAGKTYTIRIRPR